MRDHPESIQEAGAALFEAVLTIPILLVFTLAMFDLGNWFLQHYSLLRIVYEGSRVAAGLGDLREPDENELTTGFFEEINTIPCLKENLNSAMAESLSFNEPGHFIVQTRMAVLANRQFEGVNNVLLNQATSWSCYDANLKIVQTSVSMPFQSIFLNTFNINDWMHRSDMWPEVHARARAPYLFSN
jgi:Flp pilus assembly protein TadG